MVAPRPGGTGAALDVETPESVSFRLELAGLGSRGMALLVDTLVIVGFLALELLAVLAVTYVVAEVAGLFDVTWSLAAYAVLAFLTYWGYFVWGEIAGNGRTWGKKAVGLRVVRDDGSRVAFVDSAIRNIVRIVDILPGTYGVAIASALISRDGKRLGDLAAGTVVVREREEGALRFDGATGPPRVALAREFLDRREGLTPQARMQVGAELLGAFGEEVEGRDETRIARRLAELSGWKGASESDTVNHASEGG